MGDCPTEQLRHAIMMMVESQWLLIVPQLCSYSPAITTFSIQRRCSNNTTVNIPEKHNILLSCRLISPFFTSVFLLFLCAQKRTACLDRRATISSLGTILLPKCVSSLTDMTAPNEKSESVLLPALCRQGALSTPSDIFSQHFKEDFFCEILKFLSVFFYFGLDLWL